MSLRMNWRPYTGQVSSADDSFRDPQWLDYWSDIGMISFVIRPIQSTAVMNYFNDRFYELNIYEDSGDSSKTVQFWAWDIQHAQRLADGMVAEYIDESIMGGECRRNVDLRSITMSTMGESYQRLIIDG